ncbi:hypothetical protein HYH03_001579 [Edaphochlamys debaryana]|uniref:EF-hand domain-containing protein n=1 Tax=Edaphochlamys debaryana TaxID=47281 RepID=A0A836C6K8_9CHLO|nr:hypothetical protein HYH03_001579 [Edaphochlamys debaryana]|eukprot:KAG2500817.1 hypothetical protein HYH03_001579 [Edaphochlamys debaryana]
MPRLMQAVEAKVRNFVQNSEQFKQVCRKTFAVLDRDGRGRVSSDEAASCVEALFEELQQACTEYGIELDPLGPNEVLDIFRECDYDANATLDFNEFQDFYSRVITYAAMKACAGFGKTYGLGMLAGIAGVMAVKATVRRLPLLGAIASPLLGLVPTILAGPVLGCAVVYGITQNDLFAIRHKLFPPKQQPIRD